MKYYTVTTRGSKTLYAVANGEQMKNFNMKRWKEIPVEDVPTEFREVTGIHSVEDGYSYSTSFEEIEKEAIKTQAGRFATLADAKRAVEVLYGLKLELCTDAYHSDSFAVYHLLAPTGVPIAEIHFMGHDSHPEPKLVGWTIPIFRMGRREKKAFESADLLTIASSSKSISVKG